MRREEKRLHVCQLQHAGSQQTLQHNNTNKPLTVIKSTSHTHHQHITHLSQQHVASVTVHRSQDEDAAAAVGHTKTCCLCTYRVGVQVAGACVRGKGGSKETDNRLELTSGCLARC